MTSESLETIIVDVLKEVQTLSGRVWIGCPSDARPLFDLEGFDSLCSVEATVLLERRLSLDLSKVPVFISEDGKSPLTLRESSRVLEALVKLQGEKQ